jgi:hypothetical protein
MRYRALRPEVPCRPAQLTTPHRSPQASQVSDPRSGCRHAGGPGPRSAGRRGVRGREQAGHRATANRHSTCDTTQPPNFSMILIARKKSTKDVIGYVSTLVNRQHLSPTEAYLPSRREVQSSIPRWSMICFAFAFLPNLSASESRF